MGGEVADMGKAVFNLAGAGAFLGPAAAADNLTVRCGGANGVEFSHF